MRAFLTKRRTETCVRRRILAMLIVGVIAMLTTGRLGLAQQNRPLLHITSPANGAIVHPGQTVTVLIAPETGAFFTHVIAAAEDPIGYSSVADRVPFEVSLHIP